MLFKETTFHQILNALEDLVLVKGPKSKILWANRAFCEYYGMSPEQLRGLIDAPFNEPDHTQKYVQDDTKVFTTGKALDIPEEPVTRFDGTVRLFHTIKSPIFDDKGNVVLTVGISRDITERKEARKTLEDQRARSIFSAKMATLGEMAGGIAHEINTPLATIQLLSDEILDLASEQPVDAVAVGMSAEKIGSTVTRIAKIVSSLRAFSRDGSQDPYERIAVSRLVEDTLSFCRGQLAKRGIEIILALPHEELRLQGSFTQLSQVLLNLLNNADSALKSAEKKWIRIEARDAGNEIELCVADSGPKIPEEIRDQLFEPFFTTKPVGMGTGLGLSIAKRIIESHAGTLFLDGQSPQTRFVIRLPKAPPVQ